MKIWMLFAIIMWAVLSTAALAWLIVLPWVSSVLRANGVKGL